MNNDEILQDFTRRYANTYIKVYAEDKGIEAVGHLARVRADNEKFATLEIVTKEFGTIQTNFGSEEYQIRFESPQSGAFQHGPDSNIFRRKPERQYTRGVCSGNSVLTHCHSAITGQGASFTIERVRAAFEHKVHTFKQAVDFLKAGTHRSVALERDFSICLPLRKNSDQLFLWHWGSLIGTCGPSGGIGKLYEPVFEKALAEVIHG